MVQKFTVIQEPGTDFKTYIREGNHVPEGWKVVAEGKTEAQAKVLATPLTSD